MVHAGDAADSTDVRRDRFALTVALMLLVHLAMLAWLAASRPWTQDEYSYLKAGTIVRLERAWDVPHTTFHGPLPFLANQMFAWLVPVEPARAYFFWGRLGMLVFAVVAGLALVWLCCQLFDRRHALFALALHVANPVVLANAPLMTADMAMAAHSTLAIACAYAWLRRPTAWRLALAAVAIGAALATKYLNLFLLPVLAVCSSRELWATRRRPGVWSRATLAGAAGIALALLTLHTCYLWAAPRWQPRPGDAGSPLTWPVVEQALALLPDPFVRGAAFQKLQSEAAGLAPFFDSYARGHAGYFAVSLSLKLPLALLTLLALGLWRGRAWPAKSRLLLALAILAPLCYLSLFSTLQNGIRNVLPAVMLLCVPAARGGAWLWQRGARGRFAVCLLGAWLVGCHAVTWPRYDSAFNVLAGKRPYLVFADSNLDWSTAENCDAAQIQARHPDALLVHREQGPRFGKLLIRGTELATVDPRDSRHVYHWLRRFTPADRLGSWCVFEVDAGAFARADGAAAPRARVELAIALLGDGQAARARQVVEGIDDPDAAKVALAAGLDLAGKRHSVEFCELVLEFQRGDLVLQEPVATATQRARAHWLRHEPTAVCDILEVEQQTRPLTSLEVSLLAGSWYQRGNVERAFATLDRAAPPPGAPGHDEYQKLRSALQADVQAWQRLLAR